MRLTPQREGNATRSPPRRDSLSSPKPSPRGKGRRCSSWEPFLAAAFPWGRERDEGRDSVGDGLSPAIPSFLSFAFALYLRRPPLPPGLHSGAPEAERQRERSSRGNHSCLRGTCSSAWVWAAGAPEVYSVAGRRPPPLAPVWRTGTRLWCCLALTVNMDLAPFKLDIDELLADYVKENCIAFTDFKRVWMAKKFSYIYEGRPKTNSGVFMQSLFLHCIGHMTSQSSLPQRLAGLYCLYCLYECQPYKPHFKIYLSLEEFKKLKDFVVEAKQNRVALVPALVKRMLDRGMFLFGFVNLLGDHGAKQVEELTAVQNKRVKFACDKLFANTEIESYMHMNLGVEFELDNIKKLSTDYAKAKEVAFAEARQIVDVEDAKHILQNDKLLGDRVEEIVKEWDAQKEEFYEKTGVSRHNELAVVDNDESGVFHHENEGFDEIAQLLLE